MIDILREYLVSLGYQVDMSSYDQFREIMSKSDKIVAKFSNTAVAKFAIAGTAIATFIVAANAGMAKFIDNLAKSDMELDKFARRMWTTKENARSLKASLDIMGEDIADIAYNPELRDQFYRLRNQASRMDTPDEFKQQLKQIREIQFEAKRMKLEFMYASQWIGYYLMKYLEKPLESIRSSLKLINDRIEKSMPNWTKSIAMVLSWLARLGLVFGRLIISIIYGLDRIPDAVKKLIAAFASLWFVMSANPITLIILGILALLLMLDDLYTYLDGGESEFEDLWDWVIKFKDELNETGSITNFNESILELLENISSLGGSLLDLLDSLAKLADFSSFGDMMKKGIIATFQILSDIINSIAEGIKAIDNFIKGDKESASNSLSNSGKYLNKALTYDIFGDEGGYKINKFFRKLFGKPEPFDDFGQIIKNPFKENKSESNVENVKNIKSIIENKTNNVGQLMAPPTYIYPKTDNSKKTINNNISPTFNNYGSDPYLTSMASMRQLEGLMLRNLQGVVR